MTILRITPGPDNARTLAALAELGRKAKNPAGGLKTVGEALLRVTQDRFKSETAPDGAKWARHSELTRLIRGGKGGILRLSGRLMKSIAYQVAGPVLRLGPNAPPYDAVQQFGATIRPKKGKFLAIPIPAGRGGRNSAGFARAKQVTIPPRPYIGFGAKDEKATLREIEAWLAIDGED